MSRRPAPAPETCEIEFIDARRVKRVARSLKTPQAVASLAEIFKLLGDPNRIRIAFALAQEELCVCDLANLFGMSQSAVSHSLRALRQTRLVRFRKEGKTVYYALDDDHVAHLLNDGFRHVEESL